MAQASCCTRISTLLLLALALASCGSEEESGTAESDDEVQQASPAAPSDGAPQDDSTDVEEPADPDLTPQNAAPTLSGSPPTSVVAGSTYSFAPNANDADGDVLHFTIQNKPSWASFDSSTGKLSGTPQDADVGTYANIVVGVTDGEATTSLSPFSIEVEAIGTASATLAWTAPTQRTDGSPLTDLAGFKVYWGSESRQYTESVEIDNPAVTTYVVDNLGSGTYYFATTAITSDGLESPFSNEASKTVP